MDKEYFLKRLTKDDPEKLERYSYDKIPSAFSGTDKITITCLKHGDFDQNAYSHIFGHGCPECGKDIVKQNRTNTLNEFIERSKVRFGDRFNYEKTKYTKLTENLTVTCKVHGDITLTPNSHFCSTHGCSKCDYEIPRKIRYQKILERCREKHGDKFDYSQINYKNVSSKVEIICPVHGSFWQRLVNHYIHGNDCPKCSKSKEKNTLEDFISKSKAVHGDNYDYSKVVYETNQSMVIIGCKKHGEFVQRAASHISGYACKKCVFEKRLLSLNEFIYKAKAVHGDKFDYSKVVYTGNKNHVKVICPQHGAFRVTPNAHVSSKTGCALCMESKGERAVELFLKKYGFDFIREYKIKPYLYRYDFFIPEFNIFIEFNGHQHYKPVPIFGGEKEHLLLKERDKIKKDLIDQNNGELIILTYFHSKEGDVEKEIIRQLKKLYFRWYVIDGKIRAFKTPTNVYKKLNIPTCVLVRELDAEVFRRIKDSSVLF
jgi:endogenous inhibitor of DNA gyrase (YacG/DUF329 family)